MKINKSRVLILYLILIITYVAYSKRKRIYRLTQPPSSLYNSVNSVKFVGVLHQQEIIYLETKLLHSTLKTACVDTYLSNKKLETSNLYEEFGVFGEDSKGLVIFYKDFFESENKSALVISFKGSDCFENLIQNSNFEGIKFKNGNIHSGFYEYYKKIEGIVYMKVSYHLKQSDNLKYIVFTGHSLGAAVATIASSAMRDKIAEDFPNLNDIKYSLITYGSPMVGNAEFANSINSYNLLYNIRFVHGNDLVTTVPNLPGFTHVGTRVFIPSDQSPSPKITYEDLSKVRIRKKCTNIIPIRDSEDYTKKVYPSNTVSYYSEYFKNFKKAFNASWEDFEKENSIDDHSAYDSSKLSNFKFFSKVIEKYRRESRKKLLK